MKSILYIPFVFFSLVNGVLADNVPEQLIVPHPEGTSIITLALENPIQLLTIIQGKLLTVVLPVIVVGASLYIAYELFTADGDESKLKKAWKSVAYTAVALIAIALSYAIVSIVTKISF